MTQLENACFIEELSEQETRVSALMDGETALTAQGLTADPTVVHRYYHYQLIRQTLRGVAMISGAHETISWSQSRFAQLWARIDAQTGDQMH